MTTRELQKMNDIEFHEHIKDLYEIVERRMYYIELGENQAKDYFEAGLDNVARSQEHANEINRMLVKRLKTWARKQVLLRYNCK